MSPQEVTLSDLHARLRSAVPDRGLLLLSAFGFLGFLAILLRVSLDRQVGRLDLWVASGVSLQRGVAVTALAQVGMALGSFPAVVVVAAATMVGSWTQTRRLWVPAIMASSVAATASLVTLVKIAVARNRPDLSSVLGPPATDFAFPSGHATNGTLTYLLAALLLTAPCRRAWRHLATATAAAVALLIGLSGVYLGYHWATDVLAGWSFALGVTAFTYFTSRRLGVMDAAPLSYSGDQPSSRNERRRSPLVR
jgi:undecaprenyl-diphosphatase